MQIAPSVPRSESQQLHSAEKTNIFKFEIVILGSLNSPALIKGKLYYVRRDDSKNTIPDLRRKII